MNRRILGIAVALSGLVTGVFAQKPIGQPIVRIGTAEGAPSEVLFGVYSAERLSDGRIVLANSGTSEVRIYDARGRHLKTIGRKGDGPGEFRALLRTGVIRGDTIMAYDWQQRRISWFTPQGEFLRTSTVESFDDIPPVVAAFLDDGSVLLNSDFNRMFSRGERRDSVSFALADRSGKIVRRLGRYAGEEMFFIGDDGIATRIPVRFGRNVFSAGNGSRVVVGSNDAYKLDVWIGADRKVIADAKVPMLKVQTAEVKQWNDAYVETANVRVRKMVEAKLPNVPTRATHPPFEGILVGDDGAIWTGSPRVPPKPRTWTARSLDGAVTREVSIPSGIEPLSFGSSWMIGRFRDELGVEYLHVYNLPK